MGDFSVQISNKLLNQLADDGQKEKRKIRKPKPKAPREPKQPQAKVAEKKIPHGSDVPKGAGPGWPLQPPLFLPATSPVQSSTAELEGIRSVLQESEKVVEKLQKQEENMVQEVTQRAKELREKEFKLPYQKPMPCLAELDSCAECIKANNKNLLKCSEVVNNYADCARRARQQATQES